MSLPVPNSRIRIIAAVAVLDPTAMRIARESTGAPATGLIY
jgi:hypothetical protein